LNLLEFIYIAGGAFVPGFLLLFAVTAVHERRARAFVVSLAVCVVWCLVWYGGHLTWSYPAPVMIVLMATMIVSAVLFFGHIGRVRQMEVRPSGQRYDERDTVFAREEYEPGSCKYETYYSRHPELRDTDDRMRGLPELLEPGGRYYDADRSGAIADTFRIIRGLTTAVDGDVVTEMQPVDPIAATRQIKRMVLEMGAEEVGIATLDRRWVYSDVGRGPEPWGQPIDTRHRFVIVFALEMAYDQVEQAPQIGITEETARGYLQAAQIATGLARHIRGMGYPARAHIAGSNYQVILPAVAYDAGLGELGRMGYLISRRLGARIRLGAVTTDLPLVTDQPIAFGVQDFCDCCKKCVDNCPSRSIPDVAPTFVRGVEKWPLNAESCIRYWRAIGTDCGLCMKVCPYAHPSTLVHRVIQHAVSRSSVARRLAVWGDDLFYGRRAKYDRSAHGREV